MRHCFTYLSREGALIWTAGVVAAALAAGPAVAQVQTVAAEPEARNMRLVGFNDLHP